MASVAPFLVCLCFGLLAISASGLTGMHLLPPWLLGPLLRLRAVANTSDGSGNDAESSGPEAVLLQRLRKVDVAREPQTAYALHAAIGNIFRASGRQGKQALQHFEAARDAAALGNDQDTLLTAHLDLAEAYVEDGRPLDSQRELAVASGVLADHFVEHRSKLNRGRGRAKFELGFTESALQYFKEADQTAVQAEEKVRVACDLAMAYSCLGKNSESLQASQQALKVLHTVRKASADQDMPAAVHSELAADVHFRLAEAYHSSANAAFAKAHYMKALHLQQKSPRQKGDRISVIKRGVTYLDHGIGPELRCPRLPVLPWNEVQAPHQSMKDSKFATKVKLLLAEKRYVVVESELKASLRTQSRPYKSPEAAVALNMLGNLYRKQSSFSKAAKHFRQALHAAIVCCGAGDQEAQTAYAGLRDTKVELPLDEQRIATAAIQRFFDVLEKTSASADGAGTGRKNENARHEATIV